MKKLFLLSLSIIFVFNVVANADYFSYKAYLKGLLAQKQNNIEVAKEEYEKVIAYDNSAILVYKELANIYWQMGNGKKALEITQKLEELDGDSVKTNMFLGAFYLSTNEPQLAKKAWDKVLQIDPKNEMAAVYLASYYYSDNKLKESVDYWNKFLQQQPESAEGYFQLGLVQEKLGMLEEALQSYKKVNELKTEAKEAYLARARIYETQKQFDLAINEYENYVNVFPNNISILLYLGKCYFEEQKYDKAEEVLLKAKKIAPQNITVYYMLGITYEKQGNIRKAIDSFEYIAKKEPTHQTFARLGYYYALNKDYKLAEQNFNKAIELEPINPEYLYLLGLNYIDYKKFDKAKDALNKALSLKPFDIAIKFYLAIVYDELGDFNTTEKLLNEILTIDSNNVRALNYLGYNYAQKNINLDKAQELLVKVVTLAPNEQTYLDSLAWLYYRLEKYQEAEKYMFMAINTQPQLFDKTLYEHLGDISIELNKLQQAWVAYAISYDLGSKESYKKMKLIENKCSQEDINKVISQRAISNFVRFPTCKLDYKARIDKDNIKINSLINVMYADNYGIDLSFVQSLVPTFNALINNSQVRILPEITKNTLDDNALELLDFIKFIFSKNFEEFLSSANIKQDGNNLVYSDEYYNVIIDKKNGTFKVIEKKDVVKIEISSYKKINNFVQLPKVISIYSNKNNFKCYIKFNKIHKFIKSDFDKRKEFWNKLDESTSTSKN